MNIISAPSLTLVPVAPVNIGVHGPRPAAPSGTRASTRTEPPDPLRFFR